MSRYFLIGKSEEVLSEWPDNCVGSIVTDPPYGIHLMGKNWDNALPPKECWEQVYRVLKPGGYLCVFGGTRMFHRLAVSLEDAGFFLKDCMMWLYGSGFPKSRDVGKAIDKMQGAKRKTVGIDPERSGRLVNQGKEYKTDAGWSMGNRSAEITEPATDDSKKWDGWGSNLKPSYEPILLFQKPIEKGLTIAKNVLKWGVGAINIDDCRVRTKGSINGVVTPGKTTDEAYKQPEGRFPANLLLECICANPRISYEKGYVINRWDDGSKPFGNGAGHPYTGTKMPGGEILIHTDPDCPCYQLDRQTGIQKSGVAVGRNASAGNVYGSGKGLISQEKGHEILGYKDTGGASRFFYQAKANKKERNYGCDNIYWDITDKNNHKLITKVVYDDLDDNKRRKGNIHPTVKPMELLRYLIRLVTPKDERCLDPFVGSGSTVCAAAQEDFKCVGIDMSKDFIKLAQARLDYWEKK